VYEKIGIGGFWGFLRRGALFDGVTGHDLALIMISNGLDMQTCHNDYSKDECSAIFERMGHVKMGG
jgi:hypothetical protein